MRQAHILLIEGRNLGDSSLSLPLQKEGLLVTVAHTATAAQVVCRQQMPNLIIYDAITTRSNGARTCRRLRRQENAAPIIHCRPQGEPEPTDADADIYLAQPFTPRKLLNRIRALLPADPHREEIIRQGHIIFYRHKRSLSTAGQGEQRLTPKMAHLLEEFLRHPGEILDRKWLMETVWKTSYIGDTRTLDVHIRWIRELIEINPADPQILTTVRTVGYVYTPLHLPPPAADASPNNQP